MGILASLLGQHVFILYGFYGLWRLQGPGPVQTRRIALLVIIVHVLMAIGYAVARGPIAWESGRTARSTSRAPRSLH